ncbi:MAG: methylenetetrahydrofolate reductase [NAD(P)H] [Alphaproteobacteria bacterium]|nr:methylenetetrahydrofolate reductase [NAD(P)H] [Alphaproteobacteria bacterium]
MAASPTISFEIFPPKTPRGDAALDSVLEQLAALRPAFWSVTYGADGSGQERTLRLVERLIAQDMPLAAHLTCVGATRGEVDALARTWRDMGIRRIVALRGDMPGGGKWQPHEGGYQRASELVAGLSRVADFDIAVAAYPEAHPDSPSPRADLDNLKAKQDAGAGTAITQYCFDTDTILRFRDRAAAAGITIPIVPGIMPVVNFASIVNFSARCGAGIPDWLAGQFEGLEDDPETAAMVAASVASEQCRTLIDEGFDSFHFYTLNKAPLSYAVCRYLGINPPVAEAA